MKRQWQRIEAKIDALSLRERALMFAIAALALITLVNTALLDPLLGRQKQLAQHVKLDQQQIAAMHAAIQATVAPGRADPDAADLERLKNLRLRSAKLQAELQGLQKGLVSPDKMANLLEGILKRNGKLRLVSLRKLPALALNAQDSKSGVRQGPQSAPAAANDATVAAGNDTVYEHAVEIVVQGGYLDIMTYLSQLENMPWQLFWSSASLQVDTYPNATLTLKLFTLSLDKTWLNI